MQLFFGCGGEYIFTPKNTYKIPYPMFTPKNNTGILILKFKLCKF